MAYPWMAQVFVPVEDDGLTAGVKAWGAGRAVRPERATAGCLYGVLGHVAVKVEHAHVVDGAAALCRRVVPFYAVFVDLSTCDLER